MMADTVNHHGQPFQIFPRLQLLDGVTFLLPVTSGQGALQVVSPQSLGSFSSNSDSTVHFLGEALLRAQQEAEHPPNVAGVAVAPRAASWRLMGKPRCWGHGEPQLRVDSWATSMVFTWLPRCDDPEWANICNRY